MRYIDLSVDNERIKGAGVQIGAAGSHDAVALRLTFSDIWDGLTKRVLWIDSRGSTRTETILTTPLAETENVYVVPVPAAPLQYAGKMSVTIYGVEIDDEDEVLKVVTEAVYFPILTSFYDAESDPDGPIDIDPTIADQLQEEIDEILDDILEARGAEAWAVGQIDGVDVPDTDPRYHNNSKYYAEQAAIAGASAAETAIGLVRTEMQGYVSSASDSKDAAAGSATAASGSATLAESYAKGGTSTRSGEDTDNAKYYKEQADASAGAAAAIAAAAEDSAEDSEAWAVGQRDGTDVPSTDPTYHNNAKYWSDQAQAAAGGGVTSFNGRTGAVNPANGDYTASQVGAVPTSRTVNSKALSSDITLSASDVGARASDWMPSAADVGAIAEPSVSGTAGQVLTKTADGQEWATPTGGVTSFNSRTGAVVPQASDYPPSLIGAAPLANNAGAHNSIYRGKYLGSEVTAAQYDAIDAGTFDDLYVGDYWTINNVDYVIAGFDYWLGVGDGDTEFTAHHLVVVPRKCLYNAKMNDSNTTTGGYTGSKMYTTNLADAKTTINAAFPGHVPSHRLLLTNAVSGGKPSGWAWFDSTVDLMNEVMVYGSVAWGAHDGCGYNVGTMHAQLPLFALNHSALDVRENIWLQDVVSATHFADADYSGGAGYAYADNSRGVRPAFAICKANPS